MFINLLRRKIHPIVREEVSEVGPINFYSNTRCQCRYTVQSNAIARSDPNEQPIFLNISILISTSALHQLDFI